MLGVFTLWLPPVFGIYFSSVQMSGCGQAGEIVENSVVNKPVNTFF